MRISSGFPGRKPPGRLLTFMKRWGGGGRIDWDESNAYHVHMRVSMRPHASAPMKNR
jgi:hypothetical protein